MMMMKMNSVVLGLSLHALLHLVSATQRLEVLIDKDMTVPEEVWKLRRDIESRTRVSNKSRKKEDKMIGVCATPKDWKDGVLTFKAYDDKRIYFKGINFYAVNHDKSQKIGKNCWFHMWVVETDNNGTIKNNVKGTTRKINHKIKHRWIRFAQDDNWIKVSRSVPDSIRVKLPDGKEERLSINSKKEVFGYMHFLTKECNNYWKKEDTKYPDVKWSYIQRKRKNFGQDSIIHWTLSLVGKDLEYYQLEKTEQDEETLEEKTIGKWWYIKKFPKFSFTEELPYVYMDYKRSDGKRQLSCMSWYIERPEALELFQIKQFEEKLGEDKREKRKQLIAQLSKRLRSFAEEHEMHQSNWELLEGSLRSLSAGQRTLIMTTLLRNANILGSFKEKLKGLYLDEGDWKRIIKKCGEESFPSEFRKIL